MYNYNIIFVSNLDDLNIFGITIFVKFNFVIIILLVITNFNLVT